MHSRHLDSASRATSICAAVLSGCLSTIVLAQSDWDVEDSNAVLGPLYDIAFGNGKFVAVGTAGELTTSPDGQNWTVGTTGGTEDIAAICYGNGQFIAAGQNGVVLRSTDGTTWAEENSRTSGFLSGCVYGCGRFVVVGGGGIVASTPKLGIWHFADTPITTFLSAIAFGDGAFVVVGQDGVILRSTDGLVWDQIALGTTEYLSGISYRDGRFVAVGRNGIILVSDDAGLTWSEKSSGTTEWLQGVCVGDDIANAVGDAGTVLESTDLETWTPATSNTSNALLAITWAEGEFVAIGGNLAGGSPTLISSSTTPLPAFGWDDDYELLSEENGSFQATISRSGPAAGMASIEVHVHEHNTEGATDFSVSATTIDFADGQTSAPLTFNIAKDLIIEGREHVSLELRNPSAGYATGHPSQLCIELADEEDADGDFLPDVWELDYWPLIETHDGDDDPDGDGNDNLREFEDGTDPTDINSVKFRVNITIIGDGSVSITPPLPCFDRGTEVSLEAIPGAGVAFLRWSGNISGNPSTNPRAARVDFDLNITAVFGVSLREALDNRELAFTAFGNGNWFGQTAVSFDGEDAAESPVLIGTQSATLQSFVLGPGELSFQWKASCEDGVDSLSFRRNGIEESSITGESDWQEVTVSLAAGLNQLRWVFSRGGGAGAGPHEGWVDRVKFVYPYEAWRAANFTPAEVLDDSISSKSADADGDGIINYLEYIFDFPPKGFDGRTGLDSFEVDVLGERFLQLFYRIRKGRLDGANAGIRVSENLAGWQLLAVEPTVVADDLEGITYTVLPPEGIGASDPFERFYRLEIEPSQ